MKKILLIVILATFVFSSCKKDTLGVSRITTYPLISLKGSPTMFWAMNTTFVDPGCTAIEGTSDISTKITATSIDVTKGGKYTINYKVLNSDGFSATVSRTVYVYDPTSQMNGIYKSTISRTTTTTGAIANRGPFNILVFGVGGSNFWVEDLMGGYYYYGSAYGVTYAGTAVLQLNTDNTLTVVKSFPTAFSAASACVFVSSSTYNTATKTILTHSSMGDTPQYLFNVTLNNPSPLF